MSQERTEEGGTREREPDIQWCIEDFELGNVIGKGRFGRVYVAKERMSECLVAIKVLSKASITDDMRDQVFDELVIHSVLRHPHIIPLYAFFHNAESMFTVMEYACSNSLYAVMRQEKFKRFTEDKAVKYIRQVGDALYYLHCRKYMHRDVKPENVLVDIDGDAKLADFGWATSSDVDTYGYCGTPEYMAPEVIQQKSYKESVDIWSLGVMTFELLVGRSPFRSSTPTATTEKIMGRKISFPQVVKEDAQSFILGLVELNPRKRRPLDKVIDHPWIQRHCVQ